MRPRVRPHWTVTQTGTASSSLVWAGFWATTTSANPCWISAPAVAGRLPYPRVLGRGGSAVQPVDGRAPRPVGRAERHRTFLDVGPGDRRRSCVVDRIPDRICRAGRGRGGRSGPFPDAGYPVL